MRMRVVELVDGDVVRDQQAGEYTTGSIPRVRLDAETEPPARTDEPEVADGYDDGVRSPDAAEPRERVGLLRRGRPSQRGRASAAQTSN